MAKKKKNKKDKIKLKNWWNDYEGNTKKDKDDDKKKKKNKKFKDEKSKNNDYAPTPSKEYKGPKLLRNTPTLSKKDAELVHKLAKKRPKIDKRILAKRDDCNHCQPVMTVAEFKNSPLQTYVSPMLEKYVAVFGEENVAVCSACLDVLVDEKELTEENVTKAFLIAHASIDNLTANVRMKKKELESMKEDKAQIVSIMDTVLPMLKELREAQAEYRANKPASTAYGAAAPAGSAETTTPVNRGNGFTLPDGVNL